MSGQVTHDSELLGGLVVGYEMDALDSAVGPDDDREQLIARVREPLDADWSVGHVGPSFEPLATSQSLEAVLFTMRTRAGMSRGRPAKAPTTRR